MVLLKHWNRQFHFNTFYSIENQAHEVEGKMAQHIKCVSICFGINSLMKRSIKNSGVFFPRTHLHIIDKWQALIFRFHWHNLQIFPNFWARKWFRNYMDWFIARMLVGSMYHYSVTFWQLTTKRWKKQCERGDRNIYPDVLFTWFDFEFWFHVLFISHFPLRHRFSFPVALHFIYFPPNFQDSWLILFFTLPLSNTYAQQYLCVLLFWKRDSLWALNGIS